MSQLTAADIKVGRVYSARRPQRVGMFPSLLNDRQVLWIGALGTELQYDSPTVAIGRRQPKVSVEAFLRWAREDVTDKCPKDAWRAAP